MLKLALFGFLTATTAFSGQNSGGGGPAAMRLMINDISATRIGDQTFAVKSDNFHRLKTLSGSGYLTINGSEQPVVWVDDGFIEVVTEDEIQTILPAENK